MTKLLNWKKTNQVTVCSYQTENKTVDLKICKYLEENSPLYFLWQILFFFVSIFGLFDKRGDRYCIVIEYHAKITLSEQTDATIRLNFRPDKNIAATITTEADVEEQTNTIFVDKAAKKRKKIATVIKLLLCAVAVLLIGIIIFNRC